MSLTLEFRRSVLFALLAPVVLAGCTLLRLDRTECAVDGDCAAFDTGATCGNDGYCIPGQGLSEPLQVGLLYVGPVGDHGWTKAHDDGRKFFEAAIPGITAAFAPSVSVTDAPARIDEFVARGDNVVMATSFDFLVPIQSAALRYPDVNFLLCSGFVSGPNLGSYFGRMYQVMYQAGRLAGQMTRNNLIGLVGPVVIPETVRHINAFTLGARSVNPAAQVRVRWVFAWFNPDEETAAANELLDAGVDILFGHTDTTIPIETANARSTPTEPIYTIGYDNPDSCNFAPETCLTSAYWNWGPINTRLLQQIQDGTWDPAALPWDQMKADPEESTAYLSDLNETLVPSAVRLDVEGLVNQLSTPDEEGLYLPFRGPLRDNQANLRVAEGEFPTDENLLQMCWFVNGVFNVDGTRATVPMQCVGDR